MTYFLYGLLGALIFFIPLVGGFALGWKLRGFWFKPSVSVTGPSPPVEPELTPEQQERLEQQERELAESLEHFNNLLNYNTEMAYGMADSTFPGGDLS